MLERHEQDKPTRWKIIPTTTLTKPAAKLLAHRLNCLGSSFYFMKVGLRRHRLDDSLHGYMASLLENWHLKEVIEIPRDHFKTTVFAEGATMWQSLPFTQRDEEYMRKLGYDNEWIRWMKKAHNQNARNLVVSSTIDNAIKIGRRVSHHYEHNDLFRALFPEIMPDSRCVWNDKCMIHKRTKDSPNGEGTYDFLGVGAALQSRHYDGKMVEDDLVGRDKGDKDDSEAKAVSGISTAQIKNAIDYHKLLPGAFDSVEGFPDEETDEIVVGNRWALNDLNAYIKENEPWFQFSTHSALGGCCEFHPAGVPIFPSEFSKAKLERLAIRFGLYDYSCHYLNQPVNPGTTEFQESWLKYYKLMPFTETDRRACIREEVKDGEVIPPVDVVRDLKIVMICDPNHAQNRGRCRHAISVVGYDKKTDKMYLLGSWAKSCLYEELVDEIYKMAEFWKLPSFFLEEVAAQNLLSFYLKLKNKVTGKKLIAEPLKIDYSPDAKFRRIRAMNAWFQGRRFYIQRSVHEDFKLEYVAFPYAKTFDIIDTVAYAPQVFGQTGTTSRLEVRRIVRELNMKNPMANIGIAGY